MSIFEDIESNVRSYCRSFPAVFDRASGSYLFSESGVRYIDFFCGAGALNYGHNNSRIKKEALEYLSTDRVLHALDMHTVAKRMFLEKFQHVVLKPRGLDYKIQFCGPTGTNAVEAALKLARKATGRSWLYAFDGAFHGMTLGSLAVSSNRSSRRGAGIPLPFVTFLSYPRNEAEGGISLAEIERLLNDSHSGVEKPAAIILETVQAEGGVNIAPVSWLRGLRTLCDKHNILLICDDVQVGCFRTGSFFSFERSGIVPDMVILSKSISGIGFPMSLLLMRPHLDVWQPGEHTGTFRGNQIAFVTAAAALDFAAESRLHEQVRFKEKWIADFMGKVIEPLHPNIKVRGIGMIWGVDLSRCGRESVTASKIAQQVATKCFDCGLIIECAGRDDTVLKLLPPLTIETSVLEKGCNILAGALHDALGSLEDVGSVAACTVELTDI